MKLDSYYNEIPDDLKQAGTNPEFQLFNLYVYNSFFGADPLRTEDLKDGEFYSRSQKFNIDGVYLNENLEESTIECVFSYYVGDDSFDVDYVADALKYMRDKVADIVVGNKDLSTIKMQDRFNDLRIQGEDTIDEVLFRVITDYEPKDENEKFLISKKIENQNVAVKKLNVSSVISFGDDIVDAVNSNKAPFDFVQSAKIDIDSGNNILKFEDHSIVCNIKASSIKKMWKSDGKKGLLAMNLRYYVKSKNIDEKIVYSIQEGSDDFWYLNNGIIIVCNDYTITGDSILLNEFSIVNGGQTTRMIGETPFEKDFYVTCKIIKNIFETNDDKNLFVSKVAEASNTQKPIKAKDIIANRVEQRNLKSLMGANDIFVEVKRGDKCDTTKYVEPWQRTKNNELAQDLYSFAFMQPGPARNSVSKILSNQDKYDTIFVNHKFDFGFLKDLIFVEKAYKEYQKKVMKDESIGAVKQGLVKNGLYYAIATLGFILKIIYNDEFKEKMSQYLNNDGMFEIYSREPAFVHSFIPNKLSYKEFKKSVFPIFDNLFDAFIINQFNIFKDANPTLAYSNWTKNDSGFKSIMRQIIIDTIQYKRIFVLDIYKNLFEKVSDSQIKTNGEDYLKLCEAKSNEKVTKAKGIGNVVLSEADTNLRNELMTFRFNYSQKKHIAENRVFTEKALYAIVELKPRTAAELKKIISATSYMYVGADILDIVSKY